MTNSQQKSLLECSVTPEYGSARQSITDGIRKGELTKSQIDHLILEKLGLSVPNAVLTAMFEDCDLDHGGTVSLDELTTFVDGIKEPSPEERSSYVRHEFWTSASVWPSFMFIFAQVLSIVLNIRERFGPIENAYINYDGLQAILFTIGCYVFVELSRQGVAAEVQLVETAKDKIVSLVRKIDSRGDKMDAHEEMKPIQFFKLLENEGLFLPYETFESIFHEIDVDGSGVLSFNEVKTYAKAREKAGKRTPFMFQVAVAKQCVLFFSYYVAWGWVVGSVLWGIASYSDYHDVLRDDAILHLNGACAIVFLLTATLQHREHYLSTSAFLGYAEEIEQVFLSMVAATESKHDTDKGTKQDAVRELFKSLDVQGGGSSDGGDGNLDFIELYDALTRFGFVVHLKSLRYLFSHADTSGDGQLQMDEFVDCIISISGHSAQTGLERSLKILKIMVQSIQFWMVCLQMFGGIAMVIVNYGDISDEASPNWYLVIALCWVTPIAYGLFQEVAAIEESYDLVSTSKWNFKKALGSGLSEAMQKAPNGDARV